MKKQPAVLLLSAFSLMLFSCENNASCSDFLNQYASIEANIVVQHKGPESRSVEFLGIDPRNNKPTVFRDMAGFYVAIRDSIAVGDTLVKEKNTFLYIIKKKKYNLKIQFYCYDSTTVESSKSSVNK